MREIKFRGISQYTGKMVYGQLLRGENDFNIVTHFGHVIDIELVPIKKGTQGQYTNLKDKNGREIYEGDIVDGVRASHWHDGLDLILSKVVYSDFKAGYTLEGKGAGEICNVLDIEVIGNIHENPELLERE